MIGRVAAYETTRDVPGRKSEMVGRSNHYDERGDMEETVTKLRGMYVCMYVCMQVGTYARASLCVCLCVCLNLEARQNIRLFALI